MRIMGHAAKYAAGDGGSDLLPAPCSPTSQGVQTSTVCTINGIMGANPTMVLVLRTCSFTKFVPSFALHRIAARSC